MDTSCLITPTRKGMPLWHAGLLLGVFEVFFPDLK